jgi:hypothetical protein
MIQERTRGNLSPQEAQFLNSALTMLRLAFVEALNQPAPAEKAPITPTTPPASEPKRTESEEPQESTKRFSKKY